MGITGELVRSVFSKSRSFRNHESNVRSNAEKRRWKSSVKSYLCGDEFNSVLAEEDSASLRSSKVNTICTQPEFSSVFAEDDSVSFRSSEATVTQPILQDLIQGESKEKHEEMPQEKQNSTSILFRKDDAAIVIQLAFRSFLARRCKEELAVGTDISSKEESVGTSIEVQTGNSTQVLSFSEDTVNVHQRVQQKSRSRVLRLKEDWDDSKVSSNISKLRIQNKLEATTRRERALAYAFSQQLRVCSKKKQTKSNGMEPNMSWSWLERWMATRQQENCFIEYEPRQSNQRSVARKRLLLDVAGEEKESCGSNEVSIQFDNISISKLSKEKNEHARPPQNRLKGKSVSRCKTVPSYHYPKENVKVIKKNCAGDYEMDKTHEPKQAKESKRCEDATSHVSPEFSVGNNSSELRFDLSGT